MIAQSENAVKSPKHTTSIYDKGKSNISAMLNGNSYFNIHPYETEDEICPLIDTILHKEQRL